MYLKVKGVLYKIVTLAVIMVFFSASLTSNAENGISLIGDTEIEDYVSIILSDILKVNSIEPSKVELYIVKEDSINAFVYDGLKVFVNIGLIINASSPEVLYGVLAHEVGHIKGAHLVKGSQAVKSSLVKSGLIGLTALAVGLLAPRSAGGESLDMAQAAIMASGQVFQRSMLAYTRGQEEEADKYALDALKKLRVSNDGLIELFSKLKIIQARYAESIDKYSVTHPLTDSRIDFFVTNNKIKTEQSTALKGLKNEHCMVTAKINGFFDIKPSITAGLEFLKNERCNSYYQIYKAIGKQDWDGALNKANLHLTRFTEDGNNTYLHETLGDIYFGSQHFSLALKYYNLALQQTSKSNDIVYKKYNTILALGDKKDIAILISILRADIQDYKRQSVKANLYQLLSIAYQKNEQETMSLISLAFSKFYNDNIEGAKQIYEIIKTNKNLNEFEKDDFTSLENNINPSK
jgi:predicted Zn-dependent protease